MRPDSPRPPPREGASPPPEAGDCPVWLAKPTIFMLLS
ncbi:hypothetical protein SCH4B_0929 [Ruegeria sp. TrichCH4B]|nr:hypothetical protein SCH4B_0929 [Ruegeria sp. TrichCH4B]